MYSSDSGRGRKRLPEPIYLQSSGADLFRTAQHRSQSGNIRQGEIATGFGNASKISMSIVRVGEEDLAHERPGSFPSDSEGEWRGVVGRLWLELHVESRLPLRDVGDGSEKLSTEENLLPCSIKYGKEFAPVELYDRLQTENTMASSTLFDRCLPVDLTIRDGPADREALNGERVGRGREGNVCLGWLRVGRGPWTSNSDEGGGRRGIL